MAPMEGSEMGLGREYRKTCSKRLAIGRQRDSDAGTTRKPWKVGTQEKGLPIVSKWVKLEVVPRFHQNNKKPGYHVFGTGTPSTRKGRKGHWELIRGGTRCGEYLAGKRANRRN